MTDASKPPMVNGVAIGRSIVPTLASRPLPNTCTSLGLSAKGRIHENACRNDARMFSLVSGICRSTRPAWRRGAACAVASTISSNRRDARDRFLRELSERVRHGADEATVDIDRAPAHAGDHARIGERSPFELGENQVAARADDVAQHAEDVDLEILELIALKHRLADADHARFELIDGKRRGRRRKADANKDQQGEQGSGSSDFHRFTHPEDTGKPMKPQGRRATSC